ncbi:hypothetical protein D3C81_906960 [compost metagenome]
MLPPQQAAILGGQRHYLVGKLLHQHFLLRVTHVESRAHVQHTGIHMAKHAVAEVMTIEQLTEFNDVVGQMLRWHTGVLGKRDRLGTPFGIAQ